MWHIYEVLLCIIQATSTCSFYLSITKCSQTCQPSINDASCLNDIIMNVRIVQMHYLELEVKRGRGNLGIFETSL